MSDAIDHVEHVHSSGCYCQNPDHLQMDMKVVRKAEGIVCEVTLGLDEG